MAHLLFEPRALEAVLRRYVADDELVQAIDDLNQIAGRGAPITDLDRAWARRNLASRGSKPRPAPEPAPVVGRIDPSRPPLTAAQLWVAELLFDFSPDDEFEGDFMEQLLDQLEVGDHEWTRDELEATLAVLRERGLIDNENSGQPVLQGGVASYCERLNAVVSLELRVFADHEIVEAGNRQGTALDDITGALSSTGRPASRKGVALYWLGIVGRRRGTLVLCSGPVLPRFGSLRGMGLGARAEDVRAVWLADTDLSWEDIEVRGEEPWPELLEELGVEVTEDEVRMGALRLPLGLG